MRTCGVSETLSRVASKIEAREGERFLVYAIRGPRTELGDSLGFRRFPKVRHARPTCCLHVLPLDGSSAVAVRVGKEADEQIQQQQRAVRRATDLEAGGAPGGGRQDM